MKCMDGSVPLVLNGITSSSWTSSTTTVFQRMIVPDGSGNIPYSDDSVTSRSGYVTLSDLCVVVSTSSSAPVDLLIAIQDYKSDSDAIILQYKSVSLYGGQCVVFSMESIDRYYLESGRNFRFMLQKVAGGSSDVKVSLNYRLVFDD